MATRIYRTANELSEKIDYKVGRIKFAAYYTFLLNLEGQLDSSLLLNQQALALAREIGDEERINKQLVNTGNVYLYKNLYQTTLDYYLQALPYFERQRDKMNIARMYDLMQVLYENLQQYEQGIEYGEKALAMMADTPDASQRCDILCNLSNNYNGADPPRWKEQLECLNEALRIAKLNNNLYQQSIALSNIGSYYMAIRDYKSVEPYSRESLRLCEETGYTKGVCISMRAIAYAEMYKGNYKKSEEWIQKALTVAQENEFNKEQSKC